MAEGDRGITVDASPSHEDLAGVERGLGDYNRRFIGPPDRCPLSFVLRDAGGVVRGGLIGDTARGWLHVDELWADESLRGRGWGSRLLAAAERGARERGCRRAYLDTATFQAPGFYEKHGYREVGRIADFHSGFDIVYLIKSLAPPDEPRDG